MARVRKAPVIKKRQSAKKKGLVIFKPFKIVASSAYKILKMVGKKFAFILKPFKTRPFRFIGRVLSKIFFIQYFKDSYKELRLVTWPSRKQTLQLTFAVFVFALSLGIAIAALDFGLNKLFELILL